MLIAEPRRAVKAAPGRTGPVARPAALTVAVAAAVAALALQGGGYALGVRSPLGIAIWWAIGLAAVLGLRPRTGLPRAAIAAAGALLALAVFTGASSLWAANPEAAVTEAGRVLLYAGAFIAIAGGVRHGRAGAWADGLGAGIAGVGLIGLGSRLFPTLAPDSSASSFFPNGFTYLSYPLEYWNGLAILTALGLPLLLRSAIAAARPLLRGAALGVVPALVGVLYLTSSRGGALTGLICVCVFVLLSGRRSRAGVAAATALAGGAAVVTILSRLPTLVNGPFDAPNLAADGRTAAVLIALVCLGTGFAWTRLSPLSLRLRPAGVRTRRLIAAGLVLGLAAGLATADPVARLQAFTEPPPTRAEAAADRDADLTAAEHLVSASGNGRWQFWSAAADQFTQRPITGHGAGSYEAWWAQHGTLAYFTRQAHSLYLEMLGELGLAGLLLLVAFVLFVTAGATRRLRASEGDERLALAALATTALGCAIAAGVDWMWEMTVVSLVGIAAAALIVGSAASPAPRLRIPHRLLLAASAAVAITVLALPWLVERDLRDSRRAAVAGDTRTAVDKAERARGLAPWAASPWLQLALVHEGSGDLASARAAARRAVDHDPSGWRHHLVLARIALAGGDERAAAAALRDAAALNPRSPLFSDFTGSGS